MREKEKREKEKNPFLFFSFLLFSLILDFHQRLVSRYSGFSPTVGRAMELVVFAGADATVTEEGIAQVVLTGKAGAAGNDGERQVGFPKKLLDLFDLDAANLGLRIAPKETLEAPLQHALR